MDKLTGRIQRRNNLNSVYTSNKAEDMLNGVHHKYVVGVGDTPDPDYNPTAVFATINFQKGPRNNNMSLHGVLESDLLEIVRDRLQGHQNSEYRTRDNACALTHVEEALMWLAKRADDRAERGVLGTTTI